MITGFSSVSDQFHFDTEWSKRQLLLKYLFCYLWGKYLCPLNISLIFSKKCHDILVIWVDFCGNFPLFRLIFATRIRFIKADPDPADQNEANNFDNILPFLTFLTDPSADNLGQNSNFTRRIKGFPTSWLHSCFVRVDQSWVRIRLGVDREGVEGAAQGGKGGGRGQGGGRGASQGDLLSVHQPG